jgi:hypothetical protein
MKKIQLIALLSLTSFYTLSAQTIPKKAPENNRIKRGYYYKKKKSDRAKADRTIFNFADQPNLNTGSVLKGSKNYLV